MESGRVDWLGVTLGRSGPDGQFTNFDIMI
jgi:hypothetical protein